MTEEFSRAREGGDDIAIRVANVSKTYGLWASPSARLNHALLRTVRRIAPPILGVRDAIDRKCTSIYREFHALEDVSLTVRKGESWGVVGLNGSGKSTLLKMISGNLRPSGGRIEVDGKVAILDYSSGLHGGFTGRENVYLKASVFGMSRREIERKLGSIIEFADIGDFIDQPVKTYSSGMVARLGFAIAAHVDADIIITDEALAVGDAFFVQKSMRYLHDFLKRGTFLFVSHSTNDVVSLCQNAIWLEAGRVMLTGPAKDVCQAYLAAGSRRISERYLERAGEDAAPSREGGTVVPAAGSPPRRARFTAAELARLNHYFEPPPAAATGTAAAAPAVYAVQREDAGRLFAERDVTAMGGARIVSVALLDAGDAAIVAVLGGEEVRLRAVIAAERDVPRPIVGFRLKNRLGLSLFADNTARVIHGPDWFLPAGQILVVEFVFRMPLLPAGDFVAEVAVADGLESDNARLDVRHEALLIRCATTGVRHGLVGVPLLGIEAWKESVKEEVLGDDR
jgi:lipopolysaccharide transport system ATP-binding protein